MEMISQADRAILRERAEIQRAYAMNERNAKILTLWRKQAAGESAEPTVRLLFSNFTDEVITPRMRCTGEKARQIEYKLLWTLVGRELFDDDTPIQPTYDVGLHMHADPFGLKACQQASLRCNPESW